MADNPTNSEVPIFNVNQTLEGIMEPLEGHKDAYGNISDPNNRRMEVDNAIASINMRRYMWSRKGAPSEILDELQEKGLNVLWDKFQDQRGHLEEKISSDPKFSEYKSALEKIKTNSDKSLI